MANKGQLVGIPKPREAVLRGRVNRLITGLEQMKVRHVREVNGHHERIVKLQEAYRKLNLKNGIVTTDWEEEIAIRRNITHLITGLDKMQARHERELEEQNKKIETAEVIYAEFLAKQVAE